MQRIDVHAHYTPPAYIERMAELGAFDELAIFRILRSLYLPDGGASPVTVPAVDPTVARLADMDAGGVDLQILGLGAAQPYFADEAKAIEGARLANDLYADLIAQHPQRLGAFAALPLPHVQAAVREAARCLDDLGFAGIGLGCSAAGIPLDDERFEPLWRDLDARSAIVYIHPGVAIDGIVGAEEHHLAPDFVSPAEIGVCVARLVVSGVTTRYPNITFILATTGGSLPFFARRFDRGLRQQDPELYAQLGGFLPHLGRFYFDTSVLEEPLVLRTAYELVGADRLLLGSDYPRPGVTSTGAVSHVTDAEYLDEEERRRILGETAERILRAITRHDNEES